MLVAIRTRVGAVVGERLRDLVPGSEAAAEVKRVLQAEGRAIEMESEMTTLTLDLMADPPTDAAFAIAVWVATHHQVLRVREGGERIPITIADYDRAKGTISIVVQQVGATTTLVCALEAGDDLLDVVGPLGSPIEVPADSYWGAQTERSIGNFPFGPREQLPLEIVHPYVDSTFRFMSLDWDGKIRMDCSSPYAMAGLLAYKDKYQLAFGNDPDSDRHGIVTPKGSYVLTSASTSLTVRMARNGAASKASTHRSPDARSRSNLRERP